MLEARQVSFHIGQATLLTNVSCAVTPGKLTAIIGQNGAGKSTLLKVLTGDLSPSTGSVWLNGQSLATYPIEQRARLRAVLAQETHLEFGFTALEVVLLGRTPHIGKAEQQEDYEIAAAALAEVDAAHLAERLYPTLSGGEKQRVQLARVLAQIWAEPKAEHPRYLLLDEPTNSLDLAHQHSLLNVAARLTQEDIGVLAILHDLNLASLYADHLILLKAGQVLKQGNAEEVLTPAHIHTGFNIGAIVTRHPQFNCPLIVSIPGAEELAVRHRRGSEH